MSNSVYLDSANVDQWYSWECSGRRNCKDYSSRFAENHLYDEIYRDTAPYHANVFSVTYSINMCLGYSDYPLRQFSTCHEYVRTQDIDTEEALCVCIGIEDFDDRVFELRNQWAPPEWLHWLQNFQSTSSSISKIFPNVSKCIRLCKSLRRKRRIQDRDDLAQAGRV